MITQIHIVVTTERNDGETEAAHQIRVYRAVLAAANKSLVEFQPTVSDLGGGVTLGCAQIIPNK